MTPPTRTVWRSRRWLSTAALIWLACSSVYILTAPGRIDIIDGAIRYEVAASLLDVGAPIVRQKELYSVPGRHGQRYAFYQAGTSLAGLPFVALAHALAGDSREARRFAFSLTGAPHAAATVALVFLIFGRLGLPIQRAARWALALAFATPLWPYAGSTFDTALQTFWLLLAVWGAIEANSSRSNRWGIVAGFAFLMLVNIQTAYAVLIVTLLGVESRGVRLAARSLVTKPMIWIVAGTAVGVSLAVAFNFLRFGALLGPGQVGGLHPIAGNPAVGLIGFAVSPAKSILLYCPPYVIALLGLRRLLRTRPATADPLVACTALHLVIVASLAFWAGDWAWGPRYLVVTLPLVAIGMPFAWPDGTHRWMTRGLVTSGVVVQLLAISVDHQRYYFERDYTPFFWLDQTTMYSGSPLFARPAELLDVLRGADHTRIEAYVPGPEPWSMTATPFGPVEPRDGRRWVRKYLVFMAPRPWPLWSRLIPPEHRPGNTSLMAGIGVVAAAASLLPVLAVAWRRDRRDTPPGIQGRSRDVDEGEQ